MMYFLVRRYPLCLRLLSKDFDICGVDFISTLWKLDAKVDAPHFSGNFFWATADYYLRSTKLHWRRIPRPRTVCSLRVSTPCCTCGTLTCEFPHN